MPCYDPYGDEQGLRRMVDSYEQRLPDLRGRLNHVTSLLCKLCGGLEEAGWDDATFDSFDPALLVWWREHKRFDAARASQETRANVS